MVLPNCTFIVATELYITRVIYVIQFGVNRENVVADEALLLQIVHEVLLLARSTISDIRF